MQQGTSHSDPQSKHNVYKIINKLSKILQTTRML